MPQDTIVPINPISLTRASQVGRAFGHARSSLFSALSCGIQGLVGREKSGFITTCPVYKPATIKRQQSVSRACLPFGNISASCDDEQFTIWPLSAKGDIIGRTRSLGIFNLFAVGSRAAKIGCDRDIDEEEEEDTSGEIIFCFLC